MFVLSCINQEFPFTAFQILWLSIFAEAILSTQSFFSSPSDFLYKSPMIEGEIKMNQKTLLHILIENAYIMIVMGWILFYCKIHFNLDPIAV